MRVYEYPRQLDLFPLLEAGLTRAQCAERLGVSPHTVKHTVANAKLRLGVPKYLGPAESRAELLTRARLAGELSGETPLGKETP